MCNKLKFDPSEVPCQEISDPAVLSKIPLVSVKMITYNHEPYIARAIEGVIGQKTEFPFELVISEDCSNDGTREIVLEYQRKYPDIIRVLISDQNIGATKNTYRTDRACRGKYIAYCEGDDYWHHPLKLQKQVDFLEANPDYGFVHSDYIAYDVSKKKRLPTRKLGALDDNNAYEDIMTGKRIIMTVTVCVRATILRKAIETSFAELYNLEWPMGDTPRGLECARLAKVKYINEKLATKNMLPESASGSQDLSKVMDFWCKSNEMRSHYLRKYPISKELTSKVLLNGFHRVIYLAYLAKRWDVVRDTHEKMVRNGFRLRLIHYLYYYSSFNNLIYISFYPVFFFYKVLDKIFQVLGVRVRLKT